MIPCVSVHVLMLCVCVPALSHRGDGLHMQSVFTALKEIMTIAENPPAIPLRSHLSVSLCVCILCEKVWYVSACSLLFVLAPECSLCNCCFYASTHSVPHQYHVTSTK